MKYRPEWTPDWFKIKISGNKLMVLIRVRVRSHCYKYQIILGLQTIISRNLNITETGAVI
jgi:hypothetical protein